jgi:hypothetical protein
MGVPHSNWEYPAGNIQLLKTCNIALQCNVLFSQLETIVHLNTQQANLFPGAILEPRPGKGCFHVTL